MMSIFSATLPYFMAHYAKYLHHILGLNMHVEKGLSLGYFQDIFLNVIFSCTLCNFQERLHTLQYRNIGLFRRFHTYNSNSDPYSME